MSEIIYKDYGAGVPLLLLHGFCETSALWNKLLPHLKRNYRVIVVELPGFKSKLKEEMKDLEDIAKSLFHVLDTLNIGKCVWVGHSMGGYISLAAADLAPERVIGICLINSTAFADTQEKKDNRDKVANFIEVNGTGPFVEHFFPTLFCNPTHKTIQNLCQDWKKEASLFDRKSVSRLVMMMKNRPDQRILLQTSRLPVMFISGKSDSFIPVEQSKNESGLAPESFAIFLDGVAHVAPIEAPKVCVKSMDFFVKYCLSRAVDTTSSAL